MLFQKLKKTKYFTVKQKPNKVITESIVTTTIYILAISFFLNQLNIYKIQINFKWK